MQDTKAVLYVMVSPSGLIYNATTTKERRALLASGWADTLNVHPPTWSTAGDDN